MSLAAKIFAFCPGFGLFFQAGSGCDAGFVRLLRGKIVKYCQYFLDIFSRLNSAITMGSAVKLTLHLRFESGVGLQGRAIGDHGSLNYIYVNPLITVVS